MATEIDIQKQNWALSAHAKASSALVRSRSETELIEGVCTAIVNQEPYILAWVGIAKHDASKTVQVLGTHGIAAEYANGIDVKWSVDTAAGGGPTGSCIRTSLTVLINDTDTDPDFAPWRERAKPYGIRSVIAVPIKDHQPEALGALTIYASIRNAFGDAEQVLFESLAKEIGYGLINIEKQHILEDEIAQREQIHEQLIKSLGATIGAMSKTMEWRDPYTAGHQQRVAMIAEEIAKKLGWSEDKIRGLYLAALVHDLGKIATPSEILTKPTKLTKTELTLIREHPVTGYEILKDIPFTWPIAEAVRQHHERLDGSGYPQGLKAEEIIPEARILGVADTIEAISSHRPYRPGLGIDLAIEQIRLNSGNLFDQSVVDAAYELFTEEKIQKILKLQ